MPQFAGRCVLVSKAYFPKIFATDSGIDIAVTIRVETKSEVARMFHILVTPARPRGLSSLVTTVNPSELSQTQITIAQLMMGQPFRHIAFRFHNNWIWLWCVV